MNLSFFFFVLLPFGSLSPKFTFTMSDTNEVSVEFEKTENGVEEMVEEKLSVFEKLIPGLVDKLVDDNAKHIELPPRPSPAQIAAASGSSSTSTSSASVNPLPILPVGRETMAFQSLMSHLTTSTECGFDYSVLPLYDSRHKYWLGTALSEEQKKVAVAGSEEEGDPFLQVTSWCNQVVGLLFPRKLTEESLQQTFPGAPPAEHPTLKEQIAWATHLSLPAVLASPPPVDTTLAMRYGQIINQALLGLSFTSIWVEVPLADELKSVKLEDLPPPPPPIGEEGAVSVATSSSRPTPGKNSTWWRWCKLREMCDYHNQLWAVVVLTPDLPSENDLFIWESEPVKAVLVPQDVFLTNTYGYPCLAREHQKFLQRMFKQRIQIIVRGPSSELTPVSNDTSSSNSQDPYLQYLRYLQRKSLKISDQDAFEEPYYDYLQAPLQPLADNLESQTYETFEKDPVKYRLYEEAVYKALIDRKDREGGVCLMVLGAGRGPLVVASLKAAERAQVKVRMYAVEKNPNAVITLKHMSRTLGWEGVVEIISSDMRVWKAPVKADIIVSELLGSFSDNELSPECLDGAQKFLADDGISIPGNYTSFIAPVSSQKVWKDVRAWKELKQFETAFVCKMHNFAELAPAQAMFRFEHPNKAELIDNTRYDKKVFYSKGDGVIHGVIGYFESELYADVLMSINPDTFSTGMISWFPLYFPLRSPMMVSEGERIEIHMWRCVSSTKVWYEWCVSVAEREVSAIHNPNGRSYGIGLST